MKTLRVNLPGREYDIVCGAGILDQAGTLLRPVLKGDLAVIVTDSNVEPLYASRLARSLHGAGFKAAILEIPPGEASKTPEVLAELWEQMADLGITRSDSVLALGGGVVGDLSGFAAATILRGVSFVQIPTTLLAQVDSSVGGKVAVDLEAGKNLAGAFYQPKMVLMDPDTLKTRRTGNCAAAWRRSSSTAASGTGRCLTACWSWAAGSRSWRRSRKSCCAAATSSGRS